MPLTLLEVSAAGHHTYEGTMAQPAAAPGVLALSVDAPADSRAGDALPEPVRFGCGPGNLTVGDWCRRGLATYSGAAMYSRTCEISNLNSRITLDLGDLSATARVEVNGREAATLIAPPWKCDITPFLRMGENDLSITVANTLANHYSVGIPTPYAFDHQTPSGLFGPVSLIISL